MSKNILVPLDGSPLSLEALRHVVMAFPDASITALHVVDLFEPGYGASPDFEPSYEPLRGSEEWYERAEELAERIFEEAQELADDYDHDLATASEAGDPKRIIVGYADEEEFDHIVLGVHGRPDEKRPLFGSIAEVVARRATVPVTLVR